jgi:hypothetical protein
LGVHQIQGHDTVRRVMASGHHQVGRELVHLRGREQLLGDRVADT